jgi:hypothetical protein
VPPFDNGNGDLAGDVANIAGVQKLLNEILNNLLH